MHRYVQGSVANPAAGHDLADIPNYGDTFRLLTFRARLATSAVVANRVPHFRFVSPSGNVIHEVVPSAVQAASLTVTYDLVGGSGAANEGSAVSDGVSSLCLPDFWFPAGTTLETATTALDVGDTWSAVYWSAIVGEEWEHLRLLTEIASQIGG